MKGDLEIVNSWLKGESSQNRGLDVAEVFNLLEGEKKALGAMLQHFLSNPSYEYIQARQIKSRMDIVYINSMYKSLKSLIEKGYITRDTQNIYKINWKIIREKIYERKKEVDIQQSTINVFTRYLTLYQSDDLEKKNVCVPYIGNEKFIEYVNRIFLICFNSNEKYTMYIVTSEFSSLEEFGDKFKSLLSRASKRGIIINLLFNVKELERAEVKQRVAWLSQLENVEIRGYKSKQFSRDYSRVMVISTSEGELTKDGLYSGLSIGSKIAPMMPRAGTFYQNTIGLFIGPQIYDTWIKSEKIKLNIRQE